MEALINTIAIAGATFAVTWALCTIINRYTDWFDRLYEWEERKSKKKKDG